MNDAHDNARDDAAMYRRIQTNLAIEAFRKAELKRLQLEMAEFALENEVAGRGRPRIDSERYVAETEAIRAQFELKREDYARLGKLPRQPLADRLAAR